jgi:hypothetical protein
VPVLHPLEMEGVAIVESDCEGIETCLPIDEAIESSPHRLSGPDMLWNELARVDRP